MPLSTESDFFFFFIVVVLFCFKRRASDPGKNRFPPFSPWFPTLAPSSSGGGDRSNAHLSSCLVNSSARPTPSQTNWQETAAQLGKGAEESSVLLTQPPRRYPLLLPPRPGLRPPPAASRKGPPKKHLRCHVDCTGSVNSPKKTHSALLLPARSLGGRERMPPKHLAPLFPRPPLPLLLSRVESQGPRTSESWLGLAALSPHRLIYPQSPPTWKGTKNLDLHTPASASYPSPHARDHHLAKDIES